MIEDIRTNLKTKLSGIDSWNRMAVKPIKNDIINNEKLIDYSKLLSKDNLVKMKKASVLVCFFEKDGHFYFPLIRRPMHENNHPGQIALPGGSREDGETLEKTALREALEEVGILPKNVDVIGQMTPLPVPVSKYIIYPFIGITKDEPKWNLNDREVDELIVLRFDKLLRADNGYYEDWTIKENNLRVPIFKIENMEIWGATAAILSELIDLSKKSK
ncbi:MAG: hypothetical protein BEU03_00380 [Marine Group III euryarchaeote CG-Epi6]|uniref:Nudix hydrolase domain-containing protein n=1 Tax=Marine Group III euryarchaeote CG-Epi6 TaxID=1889000 RepID=A0A1J5SVU8_9ARCH|nr:MAG: hypothetical protein BEU03_00380 [Marine Group III euryarchaeote CG-Epi6]